jgi:hypothetical protein
MELNLRKINLYHSLAYSSSFNSISYIEMYSFHCIYIIKLQVKPSFDYLNILKALISLITKSKLL